MEEIIGKSAYLDAREKGKRNPIQTPFYYYSQMDNWQRTIYDVMLDLYSRPANAGYRVELVFPAYMKPEDLVLPIRIAVHAVGYDHPNIFWIWEMQSCWRYELAAERHGLMHMRLRLTGTPAGLPAKSVAFEKEVSSILKKVNRNLQPHEIERQVHDLILDHVSYDLEDCDQFSVRPDKFSAYGALMRTAKGGRSMAVCNGYSQAFQLLLQKCGIMCTTVVGYLNGSEAFHAWNLVQLDGEWYETDITLNDALDLEGGARNIDKAAAAPFLKDKVGIENLRHRFYNCTTRWMRNTPAEDKYALRDRLGRQWQWGTATQHIRPNEPGYIREGHEVLKTLADWLPQAEGTKYAYKMKRRGLFS